MKIDFGSVIRATSSQSSSGGKTLGNALQDFLTEAESPHNWLLVALLVFYRKRVRIS